MNQWSLHFRPRPERVLQTVDIIDTWHATLYHRDLLLSRQRSVRERHDILGTLHARNIGMNTQVVLTFPDR